MKCCVVNSTVTPQPPTITPARNSKTSDLSEFLSYKNISVNEDVSKLVYAYGCMRYILGT